MPTSFLLSRVLPPHFPQYRQHGLAPELRCDRRFRQPLVNTWKRRRTLVRATVTKTEQRVAESWAILIPVPPHGSAVESRTKKHQCRQSACARPLRSRSGSALAGYLRFRKKTLWITVTDQSSIIRFIEDNWLNGQRIGQGSFDGIASSIDQMFDFHQRREGSRLLLDPNTANRFDE
jgi:hypothetical protein